jgi:hypothetical protein
MNLVVLAESPDTTFRQEQLKRKRVTITSSSYARQARVDII